MIVWNKQDTREKLIISVKQKNLSPFIPDNFSASVRVYTAISTSKLGAHYSRLCDKQVDNSFLPSSVTQCTLSAPLAGLESILFTF